ncbi:AMP-binding protein [Nocardiopsis synnemataformans]|uniref:AMP-binding protein n=1 Tax=Nocardiopsis synnemataformans TaxID=61305 RepID=UPI003EBC0995
MSTTQETPETTSGQPYDLSPFQRASVGGASRTVTLRAQAPEGPLEALRDAVAASVAAAPVLTSEYVPVPGMRIPKQANTPHTVRSGASGEWIIQGGTFHATVSETTAGRRLDLSCDTAFMDTASAELLLADIALRLVGAPRERTSGVDFSTVASGHTLMLHEGELSAEEAYWSERRTAGGRGPRLEDLIPGAGTGAGNAPTTVVRRLSPEMSEKLDELAERSGCAVADLAQLALETALLRLGGTLGLLGRAEDARGLMGLDGAIGPLTQVVPGGERVLDLTGHARNAVNTLVEQRAADAEMLGGPALPPYGEQPVLVMDRTCGPRAPEAWRILSWQYPVGGDITLAVWHHDGAWELRAQANQGRGPDQVDTLTALWSGLLMDLLGRPESQLSELALLPPEASDELADAARSKLPAAVSVTTRLAQHFAERPDAPACFLGERVWSYGQLRERTGQIASALSHLPPGAVVAIMAEPEFDLVAAQLAVLWRGGVFIPLSREEPSARVLDALDRAGAAAVLVGGEPARFQAPSSCERISLDDIGAEAPPLGAPADVAPQAPAYMMRTSGTTGRPKLLAISRGSLDNYLRWVDESLLVGDEEFPVVSSPVFDASLKQTLGAVYAGTAVRLLESDRLDPDAVRAELAGLRGRLVLNCVPGYLSELLASDEQHDSTMPITRFLIGGERLPARLVARVLKRYPDSELWNLYGPTEATATATAGRITDEERVHVGRPVAGAGLTVVDPYGAVLPRGARGEVVITGPGLSDGYVSGHEGTSPFTPLRLGRGSIPSYRTGDLGVIDQEDRLWLMGRVDHQVKVNGWRIDPEELERVAQEVEGVRDAVAVLDDRAEQPCLRVFATGEVTSELVLKHLGEVLPKPMLPASVTLLDRFDTGVTGKVDRRGLLERLGEQVETSPEDYTPQQLIVATVWREVLQQGWPAPQADFFSSGGHSLLLARLVNRLRAEGHHQLSLRKVVRNPTVASMAALIAPSA